ncbi:DUF934 domain-containing protein [Pseudoxanthobacter sp.]|uniref:DUF934 domain-containing protein n=1 Tax=Pseudoxanthobacter sp. TaxID=1925742 RepID=UPI002FE177D2
MTSDIYRAGAFQPDTWRVLGDDEALPAEGGVLLPFARFLTERAGLAGDNRPLGVVIAPADRIEEIAADLPRLSVLAIAFPAYTDGRGYSTARLARQRYGFTGEVRAIGNVLLDQVPLMLRCGFDALVVENEPTRRRLAEGRIPDVPLYYQPTGLGGEVPAGPRSWTRRRA